MRNSSFPPGWSYNPSAWSERLPLVGLAALGFTAAFYTGFYQLGIIPHLWDPFFGSPSSYLVTHSAVSRILPFPDGLLGLLGYACDMLFGSLGGPDRWRRMPWAVLAFCGTITALAVVSVWTLPRRRGRFPRWVRGILEFPASVRHQHGGVCPTERLAEADMEIYRWRGRECPRGPAGMPALPVASASFQRSSASAGGQRLYLL